jgi:hypothetical protein
MNAPQPRPIYILRLARRRCSHPTLDFENSAAQIWLARCLRRGGGAAMIRCIKLRAYRKNTLRGFVDLELTRVGLVIHDCA